MGESANSNWDELDAYAEKRGLTRGGPGGALTSPTLATPGNMPFAPTGQTLAGMGNQYDASKQRAIPWHALGAMGAGMAAAPFTGGLSIPAAMGVAGAANVAGGLLGDAVAGDRPSLGGVATDAVMGAGGEGIGRAANAFFPAAATYFQGRWLKSGLGKLSDAALQGAGDAIEAGGVVAKPPTVLGGKGFSMPESEVAKGQGANALDRLAQRPSEDAAALAEHSVTSSKIGAANQSAEDAWAAQRAGIEDKNRMDLESALSRHMDARRAAEEAWQAQAAKVADQNRMAGESVSARNATAKSAADAKHADAMAAYQRTITDAQAELPQVEQRISAREPQLAQAHQEYLAAVQKAGMTPEAPQALMAQSAPSKASEMAATLRRAGMAETDIGPALKGLGFAPHDIATVGTAASSAGAERAGAERAGAFIENPGGDIALGGNLEVRQAKSKLMSLLQDHGIDLRRTGELKQSISVPGAPPVQGAPPPLIPPPPLRSAPPKPSFGEFTPPPQRGIPLRPVTAQIPQPPQVSGITTNDADILGPMAAALRPATADAGLIGQRGIARLMTSNGPSFAVGAAPGAVLGGVAGGWPGAVAGGAITGLAAKGAVNTAARLVGAPAATLAERKVLYTLEELARGTAPAAVRFPEALQTAMQAGKAPLRAAGQAAQGSLRVMLGKKEDE